MARTKMLKKHQDLEEDFDYPGEEMESPGDEIIANIMNALIEASNNQMMQAMELTKLIVEKTTVNDMSEDSILTIFKKASNAIGEKFPLKTLWEKFG